MNGDKIDKIEVNIYDGGMVSIADGNSIINAVQNNGNEGNIGGKQKVKSRTQEYAKKWDSNMLLNDFSEWDENRGVNVKLKDVYIDEHLPHFIWGNNGKIEAGMKKLLTNYVDVNEKNKCFLYWDNQELEKAL